jgi:hypothetical protein
MIEEKHDTFPDGLPDNLLLKEKSGVIRLFSLLQIPRDMRRAIVGDLPKSQKHKKLSERENLILCYSKPDNRFKLFETFVRKHEHFEKATKGVFGFLGRGHHNQKGHKAFNVPLLIPSLEFQILSRYVPNFLEADYDEEKLRSALTTSWEEIRKILELYGENFQKSLMVWLKAQEDLDNWSTLTEEQRIDVANVVFAVATIANSYPLLLQAIQQVPELKNYYSQLFEKQTEADSPLVPSANGNTTATDSPLLEETWKTLCSEILEKTQLALEKAPSLEFIETFEDFYQRLQALREQLPSKEQALEAFNHSFKKLETYFVNLSQQEFFDWLQPNVEKLLACWSLSAYKQDTAEGVNCVTQDIDRVFTDVVWLVAAYQALRKKFNKLTAKLPSLSLDEQQAAVVEMTNINEQRVKFRQDILNYASPFKESYDSEQDYATEWQNYLAAKQPALEKLPVLVDTSAEKMLSDDNSLASETLEVAHVSEKEAEYTNGVTLSQTTGDELSEEVAAPEESLPPVTETVPTPEKTVVEVTQPAIEEPLTVNKEKGTKVVEPAVSTPPINKANKTPLPQFTTKHSSRKLAQLVGIHQPTTATRLELLNAIVWRLIYDNRIGLAYHIAHSVETIYPEEKCQVSAMMLRVLALSHLVHSSGGEVILELQSDIPQMTSFFQKKAEKNRTGLNLLGFALVLCPALLAPTTGAKALLKTLSVNVDFNALHDLRKTILEYTDLGLVLSPDIFKGVGEQARRAESLQLLQTACQEWLDKNRDANFNYVPTIRVWKQWLKEGEYLGLMLNAVIQDDRDKKHEVEEIVNALSGDNVHQLLHKTDRELRGHKANVRPIDYAAKEALCKHTRSALQFAQDWLNLIKKPKEVKSFIYEQANNCRTKVISCLQQSQTQLQAFVQQHSPSLEIAASVAAANRALQDLQALFDPQKSEIPSPISWQHVLHAELLRLPQLWLDEQWQRQADLAHEAFLTVLIESLQTENAIDWDKAFKDQCEVRNHLATLRIIEFLKGTCLKMPEEINTFTEKRQKELKDCIEALETSIKKTQEKIERARFWLVNGNRTPQSARYVRQACAG